jgi:hypothetical protein
MSITRVNPLTELSVTFAFAKAANGTSTLTVNTPWMQLCKIDSYTVDFFAARQNACQESDLAGVHAQKGAAALRLSGPYRPI